MISISCDVCGTQDIKQEVKEGRGLPPKSYKPHPLMPKQRISWKGVWNVYTCNNCGKKWNTLRKDEHI